MPTSKPDPIGQNLHPKRNLHPTAPCPKMGMRELDRMIHVAWDAGWWCELATDGAVHLHRWPRVAGERDHAVAHPAPSRPGTLSTIRRSLRQMGLDV